MLRPRVWILITYIDDFTFNCTYSHVLFVCGIFITLVLSSLSLFYFFVIVCLSLAACIWRNKLPSACPVDR